MTLRHYGPGNHPSGSSQDAHAGGAGAAQDRPAWQQSKAVSIQGTLHGQGAELTDLVFGETDAKDPFEDGYTLAELHSFEEKRKRQKDRAAENLADELGADPALLDAIAECPELEVFYSAGTIFAEDRVGREYMAEWSRPDLPEAGAIAAQQRRKERNRALRAPWTSRTAAERRAMLDNPDIRYALAAGYIAQWAETAGDTQPWSILVQRAAAAEFGLPYRVVGTTGYLDETGWHLSPIDKYGTIIQPDVPPYLQKVADEVDATWATDQGGIRALVQATYRATQRELAARGITEITVARGVGKPPSFVPQIEDPVLKAMGKPGRMRPDWSRRTYRGTVRLNPLSSWTTEVAVARGFGGVIHSTRIPASRVFSLSATGPSCSEEWEVILLGGDINTEVRESQ